MKSSGTTAIPTTGASSGAADTILDGHAGKDLTAYEINVVNVAGAGFVSINNGATYVYMPAGTDDAPSSRTFCLRHRPFVPVIKAFAASGGSPMSLYADYI